MKIYLVRHGETDWNQAGRLQGQTDIDLDAQGFAQAAGAAERLKEVPFEIAFCSPLIRARHTAETIVGERKITLTTDERLRELNFGPWEGTDVRKIRGGGPTVRLRIRGAISRPRERKVLPSCMPEAASS